MPYAFALAGFALFFFLGAIITAMSFLLGALRGVRPYAWRALLWGSIGFLAANALLLAILAYPLMHMGVAGGSGSSTDFASMILGAAIVFGPLIASGFGIVVGALTGCYLGRRNPASLNLIVSVQAGPAVESRAVTQRT
jgi:hypothetical protein